TGCANSPIHVVDEYAADAGGYKIPAFTVDDASTIYFASTDQANNVTPIYSVPKGVANAPVSLFLAGSAFTPCSTDVQELHYDSGYLYFVCGGGPIGRISTSTQAIEVFTTANAPPSPDSMALGGSTIYYTQFTG